ncbi:MAG: C-GCAxxG-C-C family (seleno)protein [Candidatus Thorarchaeota archaeon]
MTDSTIETAVDYFVNKNHNCAQSVMRAVLEKYDLNYEEATASMAGLGGGVGLQGDTCGAVTGAVAALGVLNSREFKDFEKHKQASYISGAKFVYKFKKKFETVKCDDLTGITMTDEQARNEFDEKGEFYVICPKYLEEAVRIIIDMQSKA